MWGCAIRSEGFILQAFSLSLCYSEEHGAVGGRIEIMKESKKERERERERERAATLQWGSQHCDPEVSVLSCSLERERGASEREKEREA